MRFCTLSHEYLKEGYTQIDNTFFLNYLPDADPTDVKIYLYGVFLANSAAEFDNNISTIAMALKLDEKRIMDAYSYWEEKGLISIRNPEYPYEIIYHLVKVPLSKTVRYETRELESFTTEIYKMWPNTNFTMNQLESLFEFIKGKKLETAAILLIMRYYEQENQKLNYSGVISMAQNFFTKGLLTEESISRYLDQVDSKRTEANEILTSLGKSYGTPDLEMRELHFKWTKEYLIPMESILIAAKECKKKGGKSRLISLIDDLFQAKAITPAEVSEYISLENDKLNLAKIITENLGTFSKYENVVRYYINPWLSMGFDMDALETISKFCFLRAIKELNQMNEIVLRFQKEGLLTKESISSYVSREQLIDKKVIEVLSSINRNEFESFVTKTDRALYKTMIGWGFEHEAILAAAKFADGKAFPLSYISNRLSIAKQQGIYKVEDIISFFNAESSQKKSKTKTSENDVLGGLTKEEANAIIRNIEDIDVDSEEM